MRLTCSGALTSAEVDTFEAQCLRQGISDRDASFLALASGGGWIDLTYDDGVWMVVWPGRGVGSPTAVTMPLWAFVERIPDHDPIAMG